MNPANPQNGILVVLDATRNDVHLKSISEVIGGRDDLAATVLYRTSNREKVLSTLSETGVRCRAIDCGENGPGLSIGITQKCRGALLAYIPCEAEVDATRLLTVSLPRDLRSVMPLLPASSIEAQVSRLRVPSAGWIAPARVVAEWLAADPQVSNWSLPFLFEMVHRRQHRLYWASYEVDAEESTVARCSEQSPIGPGSTVLAVVPHYQCKEWLFQCLHSLTNQTRPPDNIAVIDDASEVPPQDIVAGFSEVTLLSTSGTSGPERILHSVIERTHYDAYLVQDSDDWSAEDRLERQLAEAARTGAEMVGAQELRFLVQERELMLYVFPLDANRAVAHGAKYPLVHGASLIARSLAMRLGGFDCTLDTAADTDFALRAAHAGRIVNVPAFSYYRRVRPGSRSSHPDTGHGSALRAVERETVMERAARNLRLAREGGVADVVIRTPSNPVELRRHAGPPLLGTRT